MRHLCTLLILLWSFSAYSNSSCEKEWETLYDSHKDKSQYPELVESWKDKEGACAKSDFFYLKLAWLWVALGDFENAESAFKKGLRVATQYREDIELGIAELDSHKATRSLGGLNEELLKTAELKMASFISQHPHRADALATMSGIKFIQKEYETSIDYANRAIEIAEIPVAYRHMALSYSRQANAEKTLESALKAIDLMSSYQGDRDLMLATSMAYYELGHTDIAYGVMQILVEENPGLKTDPLVNKIGSALERQLKKQKGN